MTDPMTAADLYAIGQRLTEGRIVNVVAQRALLAEVRRLRAMEQQVRALHHPVPAPTSQHYHCEPYECDRAGEGELRDECDECRRWYPRPTIVALDGGE